ncbi:hypothetical protein K8M07_09320 [Schnuerera sp. xch1]|uniref:hypothetical protein n=1 Tax=Schnuerera sp. xch1 TaxID=2874283 RepID=UPI001CBAF6CE|nr:hypothetical protein [Schnuerera sp. xch1]MBZ2175445.1 hypothetical protein [Schnuerera sp. xch1]
MKIRLVSKEQVKNAYKKKDTKNDVDLKEEMRIENIEKVPKELFQILGETLSFIQNVNKMEDDKDEN